MSHLLILLAKDLRLELRRLEFVAVMGAMSLAVTVLASFGMAGAFLEPAALQRIFSPLSWTVFMLCATTALSRSLDYELEQRALDGLLVANVSPSSIYTSRVVAHGALLFLGYLFIACVFALMLDVQILHAATALLVLSALVTIAFISLATLLAALTSSARMKGVLLPLLLLPLVMPLFFAATELTQEALASGSISLESPWLSLLVGLDVVYFLLGLNLYGFALRE